MRIIIKKYIETLIVQMQQWATSKLIGIFIFNIVLMLLILLYSAGYFRPYFPLTINSIVFMSLIASVILLGARSKVLFLICLVLWIIAAFLKVVGISVWAERTVIYAYEALLIGLFLLIFENKIK